MSRVFDVIEVGDRFQLRCAHHGTFPIFPVSERWLDRAEAVHLREKHDDDGVREPRRPVPPEPQLTKSAPTPTDQTKERDQ